jgi:hypothetical protein
MLGRGDSLRAKGYRFYRWKSMCKGPGSKDNTGVGGTERITLGRMEKLEGLCQCSCGPEVVVPTYSQSTEMGCRGDMLVRTLGDKLHVGAGPQAGESWQGEGMEVDVR